MSYFTISNRLNGKIALGLIACILIISFFISFIYQPVNAANSNSTDIEQSSEQYWSISDGSQTGLDLTGNFTLESWVKLESTGSEQGIIAKGDSTTGLGGYIMRIWTTNKVRCYTLDNSSYDYVDGNTSLTSGTWYHLACVYDGSTLKVYVNGIEDGSANTTRNPTGSSGQFRIGHRATDPPGSVGFDGLIDEVRVWSTNRTETQLQDNMDHELTGSETNLVGYWQFDGNGNDSTSNGNNLDNNNSSTFSSEISSSFAGAVLAVRKDTVQATSTTDVGIVDDLTLKLDANINYIIEGAIFAIASSTAPDLKIFFQTPSGAVMDIGYVGGFNASARDADVLSSSDVGSSRIELDTTFPTIIQFNGTIKMGSTDGDVILKWSQFQSSPGNNIFIKPGSYLRAEEI